MEVSNLLCLTFAQTVLLLCGAVTYMYNGEILSCGVVTASQTCRLGQATIPLEPTLGKVGCMHAKAVSTATWKQFVLKNR